jgi:DNA polymerase III delta subunit
MLKVRGGPGSVKKDDGRAEKEDSKLALLLLTSSAVTSSDQEDVCEKATTEDIPFGWTRAKLKPD